VDGGGSQRRALLGDMLGELAVQNGWKGIVINGASATPRPSTSSSSACARSAPSR
jgi:hypothetical protein